MLLCERVKHDRSDNKLTQRSKGRDKSEQSTNGKNNEDEGRHDRRHAPGG